MDKPRILVVDDDKAFLRLLSRKLGAAGFELMFAEDGLGAVATARKERPDLILLDIGLPAGDGFTVLERLQKLPQLAVIPVVVVTARERSKLEERALAEGAAGFVQKPVDPEELVREIRGTLARAAA